MKRIFAALISLIILASFMCAAVHADYDYGYDYDYGVYYEENEVDSSDSPLRDRILISLAVGFVISLITVLSMRSKMKTVRSAKNASSYVVPGSFNLRHQSDHFLYKNVIRTRKSNSSNKR